MSNALIPLNARAENRLKTLATGLEDMEKLSGTLLVKNEDDKHTATEIIALAKNLTKQIEDKRVEIYDGLYPKQNREVMKATNELAKGYKTRLTRITNGLEKKYLAYDNEVREAAVLAESLRILEERKAIAEMEEKAKFLPPDVEVADLPGEVVLDVKPVKNFTRTDSGISYKKKVKSFEIVDFSLVPDEFKLINQVLINKAMHSKIRSPIPGIKWTEDEKLATRLK